MMSETDLDALDAFLAEKVMGWTLKRLQSSPFGEDDFWVDANGVNRGAGFSPSRYDDDAATLRETWLRAIPGRVIEAIYYPGGPFRARANDARCGATEDAESLSLAETLAIARACGWQS